MAGSHFHAVHQSVVETDVLALADEHDGGEDDREHDVDEHDETVDDPRHLLPFELGAF